MIDFKELSKPFPPDEIEWRVGATNEQKTKGMALAYIDARLVMNRLDAVCGPDGWQNRYSHAAEKTVCELLIRVGDEWIGKSDGAGDTDYEGTKGALSDAFKRAAVRWGIGRYLYDLGAPWVPIEQRGKSFYISDGARPMLRAALDGHKPPETRSWNGPLGKHALGEACRDLDAEISACGDLDSLIVLRESEGFKSVVEQLQNDAPNWWDQDRPDTDVKGLKQRIAAKEAELMETAI